MAVLSQQQAVMNASLQPPGFPAPPVATPPPPQQQQLPPAGIITDALKELVAFSFLVAGNIHTHPDNVVDIGDTPIPEAYDPNQSFEQHINSFGSAEFIAAFDALQTFVYEVGSPDAKRLTDRELATLRGVKTHAASWMASSIYTRRQLSGAMWARKENAGIVNSLLDRERRFFQSYKR